MIVFSALLIIWVDYFDSKQLNKPAELNQIFHFHEILKSYEISKSYEIPIQSVEKNSNAFKWHHVFSVGMKLKGKKITFSFTLSGDSGINTGRHLTADTLG